MFGGVASRAVLDVSFLTPVLPVHPVVNRAFIHQVTVTHADYLRALYDDDYSPQGPSSYESGKSSKSKATSVHTPPSSFKAVAPAPQSGQFIGLAAPMAGPSSSSSAPAKSALKRSNSSVNRTIESIEADELLTEAQKQDEINEVLASYGNLGSPPSSCGSTPSKKTRYC